MDALAVESHRRAAAATEAGRFDRRDRPDRHAARHASTHDQGIRPGTSLETLAGLKTPFKADGRITAGTSSQLSDGAAAVLVASPAKARRSA